MNTAPVTLIGNVTHDVDVVEVGERATPKCSFSMAVEHRYMRQGEWTGDTSFFTVVCWRDLARDVGRVVEKGQKVMVSGRLTQREYEDNDGNNRKIIEVVADDVAPVVRGIESLTRRSLAGSRSGGGNKAGHVAPEEDPF